MPRLILEAPAHSDLAIGDGDVSAAISPSTVCARIARAEAGRRPRSRPTSRKRMASPNIVPMSEDPVRTIVVTDEGDLPFQHYFVRRRREPVFRDVRFEGADTVIGGERVKGPAAKIVRELGHQSDAGTLAHFYEDMVDTIVCDTADPHTGSRVCDIDFLGLSTLMQNDEAQRRLAEACLALARTRRSSQ